MLQKDTRMLTSEIVSNQTGKESHQNGVQVFLNEVGDLIDDTVGEEIKQISDFLTIETEFAVEEEHQKIL